ncbi:MAG TPA: MHYT domain-containing protein [Arenibaculum sp.]|nr:MHYT domain-containing protein [Arenibaculum sp.]
MILAVLICLFACLTGFNLLARAREATERGSRVWRTVAALVTGCGVWATHFVAMLAFRPNLPLGYDVGLTALSIVIAVAVTWIGFSLALARSAWVAGGVVAGVAIGAMHHVGMAALRLPAELHHDTVLTLASLAVGIGLAAAALHVAGRGGGLRHRLAGASLFALAISSLHFIAMAAVTIVPDPRIPITEQVAAPEWVAVAVAAVTVLIIALGLVGSVVDEHLARRAAREAEVLRALVAELETTKDDLQATTANLEVALDAASAGSQAKSQFLATMSHELRTPLNAVIGFAEALDAGIAGPLTAKQQEYARDIRNSGVHLLGIVNDILDFAKLDANRLDLQEDVVDVDAAIRDALRMVRVQATEGGLHLSAEVEQMLPPLRADARRLRQVLLNLLSNAVKFTPRGGAVRIAAFRSGGTLAIAVSDTGIGIAAADIPRTLERFGQVDTSLRRRYEGTGLGLPLAKRLIELHDGAIDLESEVGVGTTVTITFPAARLLVADQATAQAGRGDERLAVTR